MSQQLGLFGAPPPLGIAPVAAALASARLPAGFRVGPSSWSFPGWPVWRGAPSEAELAREGLRALMAHPCITTIGVDRSYYRPLTEADWRAYREQVRPGFRLLVKGPEEGLVARWPRHARYGARTGLENPRFLDASWVGEVAVRPMLAGLGPHVGVFLLQLPPQAVDASFARRLERFVSDLPPGPVYAVEVRNPQLATLELAERVRGAGAVMCLNRWGDMPPLRELARRWEVERDAVRVVRWMMPPGGDYGALEGAWAPFDRLRRPDDATVRDIVALVRDAADSWVIADNKAEGCGIRTCERLALAAAGVDGWEGLG